MRKSLCVVALAAIAALSSATAGYAQAPQPDSKSANYQAKGEQAKTYTFPGTTESIAYHIYVPMKWDKNDEAAAGDPHARRESAGHGALPASDAESDAGEDG